ncbi:acyltransferase [Cryobacterium melibiosiphilum]|uniref:Acyltransferase n=1 Tax=Cryobacterium melibiosiphilum TaxID=995039 RepID=A0A3A5MML3_9MICO|nr:acyltransferase [Cryobacterium melibiosiphilum]RJT91340.1 acyltransferase [Cryobacterium melibiosiphilum]
MTALRGRRRLNPIVVPPRSKLDSIQVARGFAALCVVLFHAELVQGKYFAVEVLPVFFDRGMSGVDLFFVISGFVMVLTTRGRHEKPREVGKFLWNRFFRIYPTYWAYALALVPVLIVMPSFINSSQGGGVDIFSSFLLLPTETFPILLVAWTLTLEVWFYIVFGLVLFLPERWLVPVLGVWFALLVLVNWGGPISANPYLELPTNAMAIEFIFGGIAALLFRTVNRVLAVGLGVVGVAVVVFLGTASDADLYAGPGLERPLTLGLGFALIMLAFTAIEHRGGIGVLSKLTIFGDMSYSVYLCHVLVLNVIGRGWAYIVAEPSANPLVAWGFWIVTIGAVLVVGYLSYRLIERPVMTVSKTWRVKVFREKTRIPATVT